MAVLSALPSIPSAPCSSAAAALAGAGLGPVCQIASGVGSAAGSAVSSVAGFGVDSVLNSLGSWVADGAAWLLSQIGSVLGQTTGIDLGAPWFTAHYATMAELSGIVIVPMLLVGIIQSIYRQNASMLVRSVLVNVPLAVLLTAVAVKLVQLGLAVTDAMSAAVAHGSGLDTGHFMSAVTLDLSGAQAAGQTGAPAFVLFLGALAVVCGAVMVWVELLIRASAVYVAVLFLPLALASLAWPAIAHWSRRLADTLVALILGKFVIVSVLSLAAGALATGTASGPSAAGPAGPGAGGGFAAVLGGAALLLLSAFAPWALFRLLPFVEAGAVGHLEGLGQRARHAVSTPAKGLALDAMRMVNAGALAGSAAGSAGGAMGRAVRGSLAPATTSGPGTGGGSVQPGKNGGPSPNGPPGRPAGGPDLGPSSAALTGVGTTEPPGHGIPMWPIHPEASIPGRLAAEGVFDDEGPTPMSAATSPVVSSVILGSPPPGHERPGLASPLRPTEGARGSELRPLPRQSAAMHADFLGFDHLGPKLVTTPLALPTPTPDPRSQADGHG
jgi:hypothetical protein